MVFAETLGREVSNYIKSVLAKDATIVDEKGTFVICPESSKLGRKANFPVFLEELSQTKSIEFEGKPRIIIPLRYQVKNVAYLLLDEDSKEIKSYSALIKSFAELLIQQYYENNKPHLDSTDQFITKLFHNYNPSLINQFESEAKILGYNLSAQRLAISIHLEGFWEKCLLSFDQPSFERDELIKTWKRNIERSLNSFFTKNADLITAYAGNDRFVVFKAVDRSDEESIKKLLKKSYKAIFEPLKTHRIDSITVAFGNSYSGIGGLVSARREADLALELGERIWGSGQSFYFGDLGLLSILGDGDRDKKLAFSDQILERLDNEELRKTLESFFENNLNLTETAAEMGIHRNTVIYRLNQITKSLEADPRIFEQAMSIKIALIIKSLFG